MPFALAVARGLGELHSKNIIACDLKPENVLLTETGHAVIADFGISRIVSTTVGTVHQTTAQGTKNYMAPEQWFTARDGGAGVSLKSDMWAFACMFIHMLTGSPPLAGCSELQIMREVGVFHLIMGNAMLQVSCMKSTLLSIDHELDQKNGIKRASLLDASALQNAFLSANVLH